MLIEILLLLVVLFVLLYLHLTKNYDYWKKKNVDHVQPRFPFGTLQDQFFGKADTGTLMNKYYTFYKQKGVRYYGGHTLNQPTLQIIDLDLCKHILTKDFHHFVARDFVNQTHEYISKHLFALEGQEWKEMRTKLTPTFTSGKIKNMFVFMEKCAEQLQEHIDHEVLEQGEFEVKDLTARFTTDIIATCAFGLEVNSIKNRENEFYKTGQLIFVPTVMNLIKFLLHSQFPKASRFLRINILHPKITKVLTNIMKETAEYRKKNNIVRNDFVDLLLKVKENKSLDDNVDEDNVDQKDKGQILSHQVTHGKDRLTLEEMTAQAFVFFAAGFETAASTTSFCLFELAKCSIVQERLRTEIDEVLTHHGGKITYQALQEMTYMDQVMNETLRMYASIPFLTRVCVEPYKVPGSDLVLDKGVRVIVPSYAIHHDPDIYPEPFKFDPERFSEENYKNRHHYAFLPFGEGPRNCIGMRFGKLQVKVGLAAILSRYHLTLAPNTPSTLEIDPFIIFTTAKHPFRMKIMKRE